MKKFIACIIIGTIALSIFAQEEGTLDSQTTKKLTKEQKIEQRRIEEAAMSKIVDSIIEHRKFVLEADFLSNQSGYRVIANNLLNFILIDSSNIVIQIASNTGIGGPNGMGGITTRGHISSFEVRKTGKKKDIYYVRLMANTTIGIYDIFMNISPSSDTNATISGITPGKLNYHGQIKPLSKSKVFKAMSI